MKKIILTAFSGLLWLSSFAQWNTQSNVGLNTLNGMHFISASTGFATENGGAIYKSTDAGHSWTTIYTAGFGLNAIFFSNANVGFVAGGSGSFYKTTDGGVTWTSQSTGQGYPLNSIFFVDQDTGYAVGANGTILKTYTGGATWNPLSSGTSQSLNSVYFADATTGYAVGLAGTTLKTTDCGNTWVAQTTGAPDLYSVYFFDANYGFAVGLGGFLNYTNNGGATWGSSYSATTNTLYYIHFVDAYHGYAAGANGTITRTNDGGMMWYAQTSGTPNDLKCVLFSDPNNGVAVGALGTVQTTTTGGCLIPSVTIGGISTICYGDSTTLTAGGATDYRWSPNGGNAITDSTRISPTATGVVPVSVVGTSSDGCVDTAFLNVTVNALPTVMASGGTFICSGTTATLTASGAITYTWSTGATTSSTVVNPTVNTTYTVTGTDANSCVNMDTAAVIVSASPSTPTAVNSGPICDGQSLSLNASFVSGGTYSWSGPNAFFSSLQNPVIPAVTVADAGTYSVTATVGGCPSGAGTTVVTINTLPVITVSGTTTICASNTTALTASGAVTYNWIPTGGLTCSNCANTVASPTASTSYTITGTGSNGCANSAVESITVLAPPGVTTTPNDITCYGLCNGFNSAVPTGTAPFTYLWSTSATTYSIGGLCAGNYTVTVTDANGCSSTVSGPIIEPPALMASIGSFTNASCAGVNDGIAVGNSSGGTGGYTYLWMPSGETTATATNLAVGTVSLTVTDGQSCTNTTAMSLPASTVVTTSISGPATLCQGQTGQLTYTTTGGTAPYMVDWFDYVAWGSFSMGDTALLTPLQPFCGQDTVKLTLTDNSGCIATAYKYIAVGYGDSLSGIVSDPSLLPVTSGEVYLFQQKTNHVGLYDTLGTTVINPNGTYSFPNVPYGDYFLKVEADTNVGFYPTAIGTYYSNKPNAYQWDSALIINHYTCNASNVGGYTVTIIEIPAASGPGTISGYITQGQGYGHRLSSGHNSVMGAPLKGVDIKLGKNPGGGAAARTSSDTTSGYYTFTNVPVGSYKIYVDIPNYGMDSVLSINITATNTVSTQNNYYVDSVMIRVDSVLYVGVSQITHLPTQISVYPNPGNGNITLTSSEDLGLVTIHNSLGEIIFKEKINSPQHQIDLGKQPAGIYILRTQSSNIRIIKE